MKVPEYNSDEFLFDIDMKILAGEFDKDKEKKYMRRYFIDYLPTCSSEKVIDILFSKSTPKIHYDSIHWALFASDFMVRNKHYKEILEKFLKTYHYLKIVKIKNDPGKFHKIEIYKKDDKPPLKGRKNLIYSEINDFSQILDIEAHGIIQKITNFHRDVVKSVE